MARPYKFIQLTDGTTAQAVVPVDINGNPITSGTFIKGQVATYANLPSANLHTGEFWLVEQASGTWLLGRKPSGLYFSNGIVWSAAPEIVPFFSDANFAVYNETDQTKQINFNVSNITTGNVRVITFPDRNINLLGIPNTGSAQGQLLFWDNTLQQWVNTEITELFWDDINKRLGLGNSSPETKIHITEPDAVTNLKNASIKLSTHGVDSGFFPSYLFEASRGTKLSPLLLNNNNRVGTFQFKSWDGATYRPVALLEAFASENHTSGNYGTALKFSSIPNGQNFFVPYFFIFKNSNFGITVLDPLARLHVNGGVGSLSTGIALGDGDSGIYEVIDDKLNIIAINGLSINTTSYVNKILDEDNLISNDDTALATQQSIKKYIDDHTFKAFNNNLTQFSYTGTDIRTRLLIATQVPISDNFTISVSSSFSTSDEKSHINTWLTLTNETSIITTGLLTIGVMYEIRTNTGGLNMTNVGAPNNNVGTTFIATGTTPTSWGTGSLYILTIITRPQWHISGPEAKDEFTSQSIMAYTALVPSVNYRIAFKWSGEVAGKTYYMRNSFMKLEV